ncbi:divergent PAP2 family protein [Anaeromassilibacillus sp. An200]|uniref:divergent PAP2 family protein n=1 Tax=Anaeromassilibacillus sp. An200 TaxID=1965587 RepID=UPI0026B8E7E8|nr:divergent PAP2 family protein [Anaeromassilibacillus sp. An200]
MLTSNPLLSSAILSWFFAQFFKTIIDSIRAGELCLKRFWETGGMPSSHSATVCGLAAAAAIREGFTSSVFALSLVLATVVMYDAMGVRQAAGQHAREINEIKKQLGDDDSDNLPEKLGHRPTEVMSGAVLGIVIAWIVCSLVPSGA